MEESGCYFVNPCARELIPVGTDIRLIDLKAIKVIEKSGTPVMCGAVMAYRVVNAKRASLDVSNCHRFVTDKSLTVLKQIVSKYPYQPPKENPDAPSLLTEAKEISSKMELELAEVIKVAGCEVISFQLNEVSYATEVSAAMLKRQQATALIEARETIVAGAVSIAMASIKKIEQAGVKLSEDEKGDLVSKLLVCISGDSSAAPVVAEV